MHGPCQTRSAARPPAAIASVARVLHLSSQVLVDETKETTMPKSKTEPTKKHGDKLEPLIDKTEGESERWKRDESADDEREQIHKQDEE